MCPERESTTGSPPSRRPLLDPVARRFPPKVFARIPRPRRRRRFGPRSSRRLAGFLFFCTLLTTTLAGFLLTPAGVECLNALLEHPLLVMRDLASAGLPSLLLQLREILHRGWPYALSVVAFFAAHEMGHYLACRYYRVSCTLPFFLPAPPLFGTFGAVIRIRQPIPHRRALFDIGIAGPLAGFVVAVPLLAIGVLRSQAVPLDLLGPQEGSLSLGASLLSRWMEGWLRPELAGADLLADPVYFAAWLGFLATAMNLIPAGQFDGGHILYALSPRWHRPVSLLAGLSLLTLVAGYALFAHQASAWTIWSVVVLAFGRRHPPLPVDGQPLGPARILLAVLIGVILVLCFIPHPLAVS